MPNGAIHYYMPNGVIKTIMSIERYPDHCLFTFHAFAITLSLVFVLIVYFKVINISN